MVLLDRAESGRYKCAPGCVPTSRRRLGYKSRWSVTGTRTSKYFVGGYIVNLCKIGNEYHGSCGCYDFGVYGAAMQRPCWHIWAAYYFGSIKECKQ